MSGENLEGNGLDLFVLFLLFFLVSLFLFFQFHFAKWRNM